jgi:hypothetical protein
MQTWKRILIIGVGFGVGFALALTAIVGIYSWWTNRPQQWTTQAVTAKIGEISVHNDDVGVIVSFEYALTNNTKNDYHLPVSPDGALMRTIKEPSSMGAAVGFSWPSGVVIPAHQSVSVKFQVPDHFADYGVTEAEMNEPNKSGDMASDKLSTFLGHRLKETPDGFVFLDYQNRYRVELPSNWQSAR